jgi:hypothetical protein
MEQEIIFKAIPTAERQPKDLGAIHIVLLDGILPMMAQYTPQGWCHIEIPATKGPKVIGGKGVSHWLEREN